MKTLAVVIGNDKYYKDAKLENAVNDAKAMADIFKRLGYDVILGLDCSMKESTDILIEFEKQLPSYDASIFYFAGHGFQVDGENYLASIECPVDFPNKYDCPRTCITMTELLRVLKTNSNKVNIVIIDACRKSFERGGNSSFTPVQAPKGTLIAFSTSPNEGALDKGFEGHSIYTGVLLKFIGRKLISVEQLFKQVRKTVYNITDGRQTPWEHTSLIGDFDFNTGQLVYKVEIPYDEEVVKDANYIIQGDSFGTVIKEFKSYNWDRQNSAIDKILAVSPQKLDKNQQFILGRNLLQCGEVAYSAVSFFQNLDEQLRRYTKEGENHLLNGILYEIYFNSLGEFRNGKLKKHHFDKIMALRKDPRYKTSFEFIQKILEPYRNEVFYIPTEKDTLVDIDVVVSIETVNDSFNGEKTFQVISVVKVGNTDIIDGLRRYDINGANGAKFKSILANYLNTPTDLIQINAKSELNNIALVPAKSSEAADY